MIACAEISTQPTEPEIRGALMRVSAKLCGAPRLQAFLRLVVERTLAGEGHRLKAYTIAVEALERRADFDPQADPIVRVEAGRLRRALAGYYAGAGFADAIVISLPRGHYVPAFCYAAGQGAEAPHRERQDPDDLRATLDMLIALRRLQFHTIVEALEFVRGMFERGQRDAAAAACRSGPRLLPTAPSSNGPACMRATLEPSARTAAPHDAEGTADGRESRQDREEQQAQGPPAARPR